MNLLAVVQALTIAFVAGPTAFAQVVDVAPAESPETAAALFERVVAVGASVSAGFGLDAELEVIARLDLFVDAALVAPHGKIRSFGNGMFFTKPLEIGSDQLARARELEPTALLGLDFLFWYGYGTSRTEEERLARFEEGLEELAGLACPMVIADLPDARPALHGKSPLMGGGPIIGADQIPSVDTLRKLNDRLRDWAASRPNVIVLPLADFLERLRKGEPQRVAGQELGPGSLEKLLQSDLLHPTVEGTALITSFALEALCQRYGLPDDSVAEGTAPVVAGVWKLTEEEREKRRERERKREERRRAREEKAKEKDPGGALVLQAAGAR